MKVNMTKIFLCLGLFAISLASTHAQTLAIDFVELKDRAIIIHYDLDDGANSTRQFLVQLFSSQDNFASPLSRVMGDFGPDISAGFDKKIVWEITEELGPFKGNLSFEIRARVYVPFVRLNKNTYEGKKFKRGKNYPINWQSGNLSGQLNIELFNSSGERLWGESNVANIGKFDWYIPNNIKKGKTYRLKFTNARDRNDVAYSQVFSIRPKIPLIVKVAGITVLSGAAIVILTNSENTGTQEVDALVGPPGIPKN
jgi:Ser-Thr-rich glycosyl-phosphatidyl-inositol-anchored membrane family